MSISFKVSGVDRMVRLIANKGKQARIATNRELDLSSKRIERTAKTKAPVDTGALKNSIFSAKAGIISALVNVVKEQFGLNGKLVSGLAIFIGIFVGLAYSFTIIRGQYAEYCWGGLIAGLSAIGYYEIAFKKGVNDEK